jgi:UDP-N-acetylmuramate--alanine ligase
MLEAEWQGKNIYFIGIKGNGMVGLAHLLQQAGNNVSGSDTAEYFATQEILTRLGISYNEGFDSKNLPVSSDKIIYSVAYNSHNNEEYRQAEKLGLPMLSYPQALGQFTAHSYKQTACVAGVHGKTSTTALCGILVKHFKLPYSLLAGATVFDFDNKSTYSAGNKAFIVESCEYRENFLNYSPHFILLTSVELDHTDYYSNYQHIIKAFCTFALKLPAGGSLVFCADDRGAVEVAQYIGYHRPDVHLISYGQKADGDFKITTSKFVGQSVQFTINLLGNQVLSLNLPSRLLALDAVGALALLATMGLKIDYEIAKQAFSQFKGAERRSEIIYNHNNIIVMDDYGHHPTAVKDIISGIKQYYSGKRLIVSFMSHTYSRTQTFFEEFANSLGDADIVIMHKIFASAREQRGDYWVNGEALYKRVHEIYPAKVVHYFNEPLDALPFLQSELKVGDVVLTLGAGSGNELSASLVVFLKAGGQ